MKIRLFALCLVITLPLAADEDGGADVYAQLEELNHGIRELHEEAERQDKAIKRILLMRLQLAEKERTQILHDYAAKVIKSRAGSSKEDVSDVDPRLVALMNNEPANIRSILGLNNRTIQLPEGGEKASELAAIHSDMNAKLAMIDAWFDALLLNLKLSRDLGMDVSEEERQLRRVVRERAANVSSYLSLIMLDVIALRERAALLSGDQELQSLYLVETSLLKSVARELEILTHDMQALGLDASRYKSQLISATGSISSDLFSIDVFTLLASSWTDVITNWVRMNGATMIFNFLLFVLIIFVSRILSRWVKRGTETALRYATTPLSTLSQRMLVSAASSAVYIIGILFALSQIGFSFGPVLAGLGIAGFVVGFALQDTLSNFASGMMILFYRPFDVGDVIDADGIYGTVSEMSLVNTTILTFDNQTLIVPNSQIWGNVIKNVTAQTQRRVDLVFGIGYGEDIVKAEGVLKQILDDHEKILDDPVPLIKVHELGESSVNFAVRPWVKTDDYWEVYWDITRTVKLKFDEAGISIPFPQRDVHFYRDGKAEH